MCASIRSENSLAQKYPNVSHHIKNKIQNIYHGLQSGPCPSLQVHLLSLTQCPNSLASLLLEHTGSTPAWKALLLLFL